MPNENTISRNRGRYEPQHICTPDESLIVQGKRTRNPSFKRVNNEAYPAVTRRRLINPEQRQPTPSRTEQRQQPTPSRTDQRQIPPSRPGATNSSTDSEEDDPSLQQRQQHPEPTTPSSDSSDDDDEDRTGRRLPFVDGPDDFYFQTSPPEIVDRVRVSSIEMPLKNVLAECGRGISPDRPFHEHPAIRKAIEEFVRQLYAMELQHCPKCKKVGFSLQVKSRCKSQRQSGSATTNNNNNNRSHTTLDSDDDIDLTANSNLILNITTTSATSSAPRPPRVPITTAAIPTRTRGRSFVSCKLCFDDWNAGAVMRFTHNNYMDPFHHPSNEAERAYKSLPKLTEVEKLLIAQHQPVMRIYRLKGGAYGFDGNVVNLVQDVADFVTTLPRTINQLNVFIVRRSTGEEPTDYRDFKVSRENIRKWLVFLKAYNKYYAGIEINEDTLAQIPESETSVYNQINSFVSHPSNEEVEDVNDRPLDDDHNRRENDEVGIVLTGGGYELGPEGDVDIMNRDDNVLVTGIGGLPSNLPSLPMPADFEASNNDGGGGDPAYDSDIEEDGIENDPSVVQWPHIGREALNEYETEGLFAKAFPCLFPFGFGDPTDNARLRKISLKEAAEHLTRYGIKNSHGNYETPFDSDPRFSHYIQDVDERRRIIDQARFYLKSNPSDAAITMEELRAMRPNEMLALQNRIQRHSGNICGSDAYFKQRRRELQSLIEQRGSPTVWFTLSYADNHWADVLRLLGTPPDGYDETQQQKWYYEQAKAHPAIYDEYFVKRVEVFINIIFSDKALEYSWFWFRFEWQMRGTIHVHGMIRLKSDPGLTELAREVVRGRKAYRHLLAINNRDQLNNNIFTPYKMQYPDDVYVFNDPSDVLNEAVQQDEQRRLKAQQHNQPQPIQTFESYLQKLINAGLEAEKRILCYREYLLTNYNSRPPHLLPSDASKDTPDNRVIQVPHPASVCHSCYNVANNPRTAADSMASNNIPRTAPDSNMLYANLVDSVMRHRCNVSYCIRKEKCRFKFPRNLQETTKLVVVEKKYSSSHKSSANGPKIRTVSLEIVARTNDRWLNGHCRPMLEAWGGNIDVTLLLDLDAVLNYVAKYGTKKEENSRGFKAIFNTALRKGREDESDAKTVLRSIFLRTSAGREKTQQETAHLLLSLPMVRCSEDFAMISLYNNSRTVEQQQSNSSTTTRRRRRNTAANNVNQEEDGTPIYVHKTLVDCYALRNERSLFHQDCHEFGTRQWENMSLMQFCTKFQYQQNNKIVKPRRRPATIVFSPEYKSGKDSTNYVLYCFFGLMKYKPWIQYPEQTFGGTTPDLMHTYYLDPSSIPEDVANTIVSSWRTFLVESSNSQTPHDIDYIQRSIDRLRERDEADQWTPMHDMDDEWEIDDDSDDDAGNDVALCADIMMQYHRNFSNGEASQGQPCEWNVNHNWVTPRHDYSRNVYNVFCKHTLANWWKNVVLVKPTSNHHSETRRAIERHMLRGKQVVAFDIASYLIVTETLPEKHKRGLILTGSAGCGKSYVIDALCYKFKEKIILMAPSGKASCNIGGDTIHSALRLGIHGFKELSDSSKLELQRKLANANTIIIDEYTMMSCSLFDQVHKRCQQAKANNLPFGGMTIILVGDPGQLPPVSGKALWTTSVHYNIVEGAGSFLYHSYFPFAITLEGSNRLVNDEHKQFFEGFLTNLRNGEVTLQQFQKFNELTSEQHHIAEQGSYAQFRQKFFGPTSTWYFNTNEDILHHNLRILAELGEPILRINAKHNCNGAFRGSEDQTKRLSTVLYVSVNAKVMLHLNLATHYNLVNGSTGIVKDIIFSPDDCSPPNSLPIAIVVEFPSYTGPAFFDNVVDLTTNTVIENRSKWVPIRPETATWYKNTRKGVARRETMERTNFPLLLAWAWTPWKGQGTTNENPCSMVPGDKEAAAGAAYVMISRVTTLKNLFIPHGITLERLTTKIKSQKGLQERIKEEKRLLLLQRKTLEFYNTMSNNN